jgi:2-dehydro-3-deoxyglucarate aldolase/4-hydroxy-2-oxoheptanedioate aldolase
MVPMVDSAEQAGMMVQSTRFPPAGRRGAAFLIAHDDYQEGDAVEKMQSANDELMLIAQIETARGLDNVEEIAAVDGIDVLWIGQADMTNALGIPGQFAHPKFHAAIDRVVGACRQHGKAAGFLATSNEEAAERLRQGFRCLAYSGDSWIYYEALRNGIRAVRQMIDAR